MCRKAQTQMLARGNYNMLQDFINPVIDSTLYSSVSQPPGRGPVPGPGINYTGPREVLLEFVILIF